MTNRVALISAILIACASAQNYAAAIVDQAEDQDDEPTYACH